MQRIMKPCSDSAFLGTVASLSIAIGAVLTLLLQRIEPLMVVGFLASALFGLYILPALPLGALKVRRLIRQLRWWHFLWLLVFMSGQTLRIRGTETIQENPLDLAAFYRAALMGFVGLYLFGIFVLGKQVRIRSFFRGLIGLLTGYALISVFSSLWSVYPAWTLYKSVEYLIEVALIAAVVRSIHTAPQFKSLFDWMWLLIGLVMISVWNGVFLWPQNAILRGKGLLGIQIRGIFPRVATNSVGEVGALLGIISFVRLLYTKGLSRHFYLTVFIVSLATLAFSQSRSPLFGFLLAIPFILFLDGRISLLVLGTLSAPFVILLTPLGDYFWQFFLRGQSKELFYSLSGRVYYWQAAAELIREKPLFGYGAHAAGRFLVAKRFASTLSSLHGTWPEVLVGTGILGLLPLLGAILGTWVILLRVSRSRLQVMGPLWQQLRLEAVGVITLLTVRSIFSVSFIWHPALNWLVVLGYAEFLRRQYAAFSRSQSLHPPRR